MILRFSFSLEAVPTDDSGFVRLVWQGFVWVLGLNNLKNIGGESSTSRYKIKHVIDSRYTFTLHIQNHVIRFSQFTIMSA